MPNEKFVAYARPLIEGEVKVPSEGGLPKYVVLEKSLVEKTLPARGKTGETEHAQKPAPVAAAAA